MSSKIFVTSPEEYVVSIRIYMQMATESWELLSAPYLRRIVSSISHGKNEYAQKFTCEVMETSRIETSIEIMYIIISLHLRHLQILCLQG